MVVRYLFNRRRGDRQILACSAVKSDRSVERPHTILRSEERPLNNFVARSQLNGANGEWTGLDDLAMPRRGHQQGQRRANLNNRGAARRGGNNFGPRNAGHGNAVANNLANPGQQPNPQLPPGVNLGQILGQALGLPHPVGVNPPGPQGPPPAGGQQPPVVVQLVQPPPPPRQPVEIRYALWQVEENGMTEEQFQLAKERFVPSDFPKVRARFAFREICAPDSHTLFESNCTPFCGLGCIDLAVNIKPDVEKYSKLMSPAGPVSIGTTAFLDRYANSRGVNLRVVVRSAAGGWENAYTRMNDASWETVILYFEAGHYQLVTLQLSDIIRTKLPTFDKTDYNPVLMLAAAGLVILLGCVGETDVASRLAFLPFLFMFWASPTLVFRNYVVKKSNWDDRPIIDKRDPLESQDMMCDGVETWYLTFFWIRMFPVWTKTHRVSVVRFDQTYKDAQGAVINGIDPKKALSTVTNLRGVNTPSGIAGIYLGTAAAVSLAIRYSLKETDVPLGDHATAYNATGWEMAVSSDNIQRIRERQALVGTGIKTENHVLSIDRHIVVKKNRQIAEVAVPVFTNEGQMGPGFYPLTDTLTTLGAFTVRSMTAKPKLPEAVEAFVKFAKKLMKSYVNGCNFRTIEISVQDSYRKINKGKRTVVSIEMTLAEYELWKRGGASKKFARCGCFVKFENSAKLVDGVWCVKPRLIMTMSDAMAIECSGILDLIHEWNEGPFARFQVKGLQEEDVKRKIESLCLSKHEVTDYSSFESSVDLAIRAIENHTMLEICRKANHPETARNLRKYCFGGRTLHFKGGKVKIFSRCSGDYWTSFGNGVVNYCLMAYAASLKGIDPRTINFIAEGDDGLVTQGVASPDTLNQLGFAYSTAIAGNRPGDCDFLRNRWMDGKRYLNIGRVFGSFWIKKASHLPRSKQLFLARCVAYSLHHMSPHHPVTEAIVWRLLKETGGAKRFKGYKKYLDSWGVVGKNFQAVKHYVYQVDESMRAEIARGSGEFPPLPVSSQIELERSIVNDDKIYVGRMLDGFDEFLPLKASRTLLDTRDIVANPGTLSLLELYKVATRV